MMHEAVWTNGKRRVTGRWEYLWQPDRFRIELDQCDSTTGQQKRFTVTGESPEWGNWRREQPAN